MLRTWPSPGSRPGVWATGLSLGVTKPLPPPAAVGDQGLIEWSRAPPPPPHPGPADLLDAAASGLRTHRTAYPTAGPGGLPRPGVRGRAVEVAARTVRTGTA
ncbi:hypothetical protein [Streptomyces sp. NRRL S-378]|uniref:hypothetical protein n=1 Tax=Streptomyces sp. NRRL S-378 TaxID=1463904 RepID=UPI00131D8E83|nr:hypothetical protein [Streptomyces sp. NRRL S-378]